MPATKTNWTNEAIKLGVSCTVMTGVLLGTLFAPQFFPPVVAGIPTLPIYAVLLALFLTGFVYAMIKRSKKSV